MRRKFVAGNWKMNKTVPESVELVRQLKGSVNRYSDVDIAICPPFTSLSAVHNEIQGTKILLGAQNMHHKSSGAFTGEISAAMLVSCGCKLVILGHSERRKQFGEDNRIINKKIQTALNAGLVPILCVGETIEQREQNITSDVIRTQLTESLDLVHLTGENLVIAYEPVWAIGTGKTATPEQAVSVHRLIRTILTERYSKDIAEKTRILYGGSIKPENAKTLLPEPEIDGGLVGGASLDAGKFIRIIEAAHSC